MPFASTNTSPVTVTVSLATKPLSLPVVIVKSLATVQVFPEVSSQNTNLPEEDGFIIKL